MFQNQMKYLPLPLMSKVYNITMSHKIYTIAIVGNYDPLNYSMHELEFARVLGSHITRLGGIVASDTQSGFGIWSSVGAGEMGGVSIGFSPASSHYEHENHYRLSTENLSTIVYTGFGYLGRDVVMVRSSDCLIAFLSDEKIGHIMQLAKELQKPLFIVSFDANLEKIQSLLGSLYGYAEIYTNQQEILTRLENLISSHK